MPKEKKKNIVPLPEVPQPPIIRAAEAALEPVLSPKHHVLDTVRTEQVKSRIAHRNADGKKLALPNRNPITLEGVTTWRGKDSIFIGKDEKDPTRVVKFTDALTDAKTKTEPARGGSGALAQIELNADWAGENFAHIGPRQPEYNLLEPFTLMDVEVYVKQAFNRRLSLMMRNGYQITGANPNKVKYIEKRISQISYMMKKTWSNFLREILSILIPSNNCFLLKIRNEEASGGTANKLNGNKTPVAGYVLVPPHQIYPYIEKGRITKWRRYYPFATKPWDDYKPEDIIHFKLRRKVGHIFGTPATQAVRDDIFAIRRLEENIELLFINYLFPLFHVKVGTEKAPASWLPGGMSELDHTRHLIETMPKEGVLVTDERVEVNSIGANAKALDPMPLHAAYKKRIFTGLEVSSIDMGEGDTANMSTADATSQALKDAVKADIEDFAGQVQMEFFLEWFQEANFTLSVQESLADVKLEMQEIDMDNKVKEENHATNLYNNNGITHDEFRKSLKRNPLDDEGKKDLHHQREVVDLEKEQATQQIRVAKNSPRPAGPKGKGKGKGKSSGGKKGRSGRKASTTSKAASQRKVSQNRSTPTNQHGTNNSPHKARSSRMAVGLLGKLTDELETCQLLGEMDSWEDNSARVITRFFIMNTDNPVSSYTKHHRMQIDSLKKRVSLAPDYDSLLDVIAEEKILDPVADEDFNEQLEHATN